MLHRKRSYWLLSMMDSARVESTMTKYSKPEVHYRPIIGGAKRRCGNCINYQDRKRLHYG
jgi:hypothetical protein